MITISSEINIVNSYEIITGGFFLFCFCVYVMKVNHDDDDDEDENSQ